MNEWKTTVYVVHLPGKGVRLVKQYYYPDDQKAFKEEITLDVNEFTQIASEAEHT